MAKPEMRPVLASGLRIPTPVPIQRVKPATEQIMSAVGDVLGDLGEKLFNDTATQKITGQAAGLRAAAHTAAYMKDWNRQFTGAEKDRIEALHETLNRQVSFAESYANEMGGVAGQTFIDYYGRMMFRHIDETITQAHQIVHDETEMKYKRNIEDYLRMNIDNLGTFDIETKMLGDRSSWQGLLDVVKAGTEGDNPKIGNEDARTLFREKARGQAIQTLTKLAGKNPHMLHNMIDKGMTSVMLPTLNDDWTLGEPYAYSLNTEQLESLYSYAAKVQQVKSILREKEKREWATDYDKAGKPTHLTILNEMDTILAKVERDSSHEKRVLAANALKGVLKKLEDMRGLTRMQRQAIGVTDDNYDQLYVSIQNAIDNVMSGKIDQGSQDQFEYLKERLQVRAGGVTSFMSADGVKELWASIHDDPEKWGRFSPIQRGQLTDYFTVAMKTELRNLFKDLEDDMRSFFDDSELEQGDRDIAIRIMNNTISSIWNQEGVLRAILDGKVHEAEVVQLAVSRIGKEWISKIDGDAGWIEERLFVHLDAYKKVRADTGVDVTFGSWLLKEAASPTNAISKKELIAVLGLYQLIQDREKLDLERIRKEVDIGMEKFLIDHPEIDAGTLHDLLNEEGNLVLHSRLRDEGNLIPIEEFDDILGPLAERTPRTARKEAVVEEFSPEQAKADEENRAVIAGWEKGLAMREGEKGKLARLVKELKAIEDEIPPAGDEGDWEKLRKARLASKDDEIKDEKADIAVLKAAIKKGQAALPEKKILEPQEEYTFTEEEIARRLMDLSRENAANKILEPQEEFKEFTDEDYNRRIRPTSTSSSFLKGELLAELGRYMDIGLGSLEFKDGQVFFTEDATINEVDGEGNLVMDNDKRAVLYWKLEAVNTILRKPPGDDTRNPGTVFAEAKKDVFRSVEKRRRKAVRNWMDKKLENADGAKRELSRLRGQALGTHSRGGILLKGHQEQRKKASTRAAKVRSLTPSQMRPDELRTGTPAEIQFKNPANKETYLQQAMTKQSVYDELRLLGDVGGDGWLTKHLRGEIVPGISDNPAIMKTVDDLVSLTIRGLVRHDRSLRQVLAHVNDTLTPPSGQVGGVAVADIPEERAAALALANQGKEVEEAFRKVRPLQGELQLDWLFNKPKSEGEKDGRLVASYILKKAVEWGFIAEPKSNAERAAIKEFVSAREANRNIQRYIDDGNIEKLSQYLHLYVSAHPSLAENLPAWQRMEKDPLWLQKDLAAYADGGNLADDIRANHMIVQTGMRGIYAENEHPGWKNEQEYLKKSDADTWSTSEDAAEKRRELLKQIRNEKRDKVQRWTDENQHRVGMAVKLPRQTDRELEESLTEARN